MASNKLVLLVHGFGCFPWFMAPLGVRLRARGFQTCTWAYPSVRYSIAENGRRLQAYWADCLSRYERVHVVAHSLGSIVMRAAAMVPLEHLGNTVLLTPPNAGAPIARRLCRWTGHRIQPLCDLDDSPGSYVNRLPGWSRGNLGIITAHHDLLVPRENTRLPGAAESVEVPGLHAYILISPRAAELVIRFISHGSFRAPA